MAFDFATAKKLVRRTVNATFGVQAFYQDSSMSTYVETRARLFTKTSKPYGDLTDGAGYADVIEGVDRIVLIPVTHPGGFPIRLRRTGVFTFPELFGDVEFTLDTKMPSDGPLEESWQVTRP